MKYRFLIWMTAIMMSQAGAQTHVAPPPLAEVSVGRVERMPDIASKFVDRRVVDVWLPSDYDPGKRYQVLYMHDGQMLFDASKTWNKQAWDVHLTVDRLVRSKKIPDTLVVGVWNNGSARHSEYFPQKFLDFMPEGVRTAYVQQALQGRPRADDYLRYLVTELKPAIDARYSTRSGPEGTYIMGSSMGALISIYAMNEYPQVFGGAAGISTHWVGLGVHNARLPLAAYNYLMRHLADPTTHRLYMDHGTTELDALYGTYQIFVDQIVRERGYTDRNSMSRVFEGTGHNENAWAKRLEIPLVFLMGAP